MMFSLYRLHRTHISMSFELFTVDQKSGAYWVASMLEDDGCFSLCNLLHGDDWTMFDIRRNIVPYIIEDWDGFR